MTFVMGGGVIGEILCTNRATFCILYTNFTWDMIESMLGCMWQYNNGLQIT